MATTNDSGGVEAVEKTCEIIRVIEITGGAGVTEIANKLDISKSTVHNHLSTLRANNFVTKNKNEYCLGFRFIELGHQIQENFEILDLVEQELHELATNTGELAQFAVEEEGQAVFLRKATGEKAIEGTTHPGKREYMHPIGLGKAMLSQMAKERVHSIIDQHGLPKMTENTITEREELFSELEDIRERGYAIDNEEKRKNLKCVAAPVQIDGSLIGAVSVSGPAERLTGKYLQEQLPDEVQQTANIIEVRCLDSVGFNNK